MVRSAFLLLFLFAAVSGACDGDADAPEARRLGPTGTAQDAPRAGGSQGQATQAAGSGEVLSTVEIVEVLGPSIVRVEVESLSVDPFGRTIPGGGVGTGVIIDDDGHIVTNNHVVTSPATGGPAESVTVTLSDQTQFEATIVGRDEATDLAVLQIDHDGLTPAQWGDANELQVGQDVVAFGYALGLEGAPSVTEGVLSAVNRTIQTPPYTIPDAIQTDASINPGNSGGPLVNDRAEVIGINTAIIQDAQNVGFAISVALAEPIVEQLITAGSIERAFVGIGAVDVTPQIAENLDLAVGSGVIVAAVEPGSPADEAGLQERDMIVQLDGEPLDNNGELLALLAEREPGDEVTLTYIRDGEERQAELTLGARPRTADR